MVHGISAEKLPITLTVQEFFLNVGPQHVTSLIKDESQGSFFEDMSAYPCMPLSSLHSNILFQFRNGFFHLTGNQVKSKQLCNLERKNEGVPHVKLIIHIIIIV